jgi:8-oxo-dGTP pyrophosphatase MutT (NUDIX family)
MNSKNIKISSNRNFGVVFFIFFMIISLFTLFKDGNVRVWAVVVAIIFLILGLLNSSVLSPLNKIWFKFGILLGNFISPIIMGLVFFKDKFILVCQRKIPINKKNYEFPSGGIDIGEQPVDSASRE